MYQLQQQTDTKRTYRSSITGTEVSTYLLHTGQDGANWWAFEDLLNIPFIRKKAAEKLTQLYGAGITKEDLTKIVSTLKTLLRSQDPEKYERAYSEVLQLEEITEQTADPVKQSLSLCAVYILSDDEQVDTFSSTLTRDKMEKWALQTDLQAFFLNFLTSGMNAYTTLYDSISQTALSLEK